MHSVPVPINVRCYSNSDIIVRRSEVTLRARSDVFALQHTASLFVGTRARRILTVNHTELECAVLAAEPSEC